MPNPGTVTSPAGTTVRAADALYLVHRAKESFEREPVNTDKPLGWYITSYLAGALPHLPGTTTDRTAAFGVVSDLTFTLRDEHGWQTWSRDEAVAIFRSLIVILVGAL